VIDQPVMNRGLQRERTSLAWTRTALALVANGLLVLVRHEHAFPLGVAVALSVLWLGLALLVLWYSNRRGQLVSMPDHEIGAAYGFVVSLAVAVATLCAATALAIAWT
jgi:hypothetical protein